MVDLVWVHLNNDIFLAWKFGRLKSMVDCPFEIIVKRGENAYKLEMPDDYDISHTFMSRTRGLTMVKT